MRIPRLFIVVTVIFIIAACNIYRPLSSKSSTEDILEEALKCLHEHDYECAIENYNSLPPGDLKNEHLCKVYLAKAGLTLDALLNVATIQSNKMLCSLANAVGPYTSDKEAAALAARSN